MTSSITAGRIEALRQLMDRDGVDQVLLSIGADLPYFTGYEAMPLERLTMLVVGRESDVVLVVPQLEAPRVEPGTFAIRPWSETEDPLGIVGDLCKGAESIAIGDQTWSSFLLGLQERLPNATFHSATPLTRHLRARKDADEIERLRAAAAGVDRVVQRLGGVQFRGRTERDLARQVTAMTLEEDHDQALFWIVASGPNSASPHHEPGERVIDGLVTWWWSILAVVMAATAPIRLARSRWANRPLASGRFTTWFIDPNKQLPPRSIPGSARAKWIGWLGM